MFRRRVGRNGSDPLLVFTPVWLVFITTVVTHRLCTYSEPTPITRTHEIGPNRLCSWTCRDCPTLLEVHLDFQVLCWVCLDQYVSWCCFLQPPHLGMCNLSNSRNGSTIEAVEEASLLCLFFAQMSSKLPCWQVQVVIFWLLIIVVSYSSSSHAHLKRKMKKNVYWIKYPHSWKSHPWQTLVRSAGFMTARTRTRHVLSANAGVRAFLWVSKRMFKVRDTLLAQHFDKQQR